MTVRTKTIIAIATYSFSIFGIVNYKLFYLTFCSRQHFRNAVSRLLPAYFIFVSLISRQSFQRSSSYQPIESSSGYKSTSTLNGLSKSFSSSCFISFSLRNKFVVWIFQSMQSKSTFKLYHCLYHYSDFVIPYPFYSYLRSLSPCVWRVRSVLKCCRYIY